MPRGQFHIPLSGPVWAIVAVLAFALPCAAQTIDDVRDQFRANLSAAQFTKSFAGIVASSNELSLASARYSLNRNSRLSITALPFGKTFHPWGETDTGIYLEGALGYSQLKDHTEDIWSGGAPGFETSVTSRSTILSSLVGAGPQFTLAEGLTFAPLANVSVAYLKNDTSYAGPGAAVTAAIADGIAFNWDGLLASEGVAARMEWKKDLNPEHTLTLLARYDLRWTQTIRTDDPAQEFSTRSQLVTFRADIDGPTGLTVLDSPLRWRATTGYRAFLEGDLEDANDFYTVGGSLELTNAMNTGSTVSLDGTFIFGHEITGFGIGLGMSF